MALKIAVLLSGNGTTLQNLLDRIAAGDLDVKVVCVLSSRADAYGIERAKNAGVPACVVARRDHSDVDSFSKSVWEALEPYGPELVALAGFMSLLKVPETYTMRIINVHPALIPAFSGKGMYGHHVHEAVLESGVKVTGVTVHFVDNEYDHGPIILQESVPVLEDDTADTLEERVQAKERELYPKAMQLYAQGRLKVEGGRVRVAP